MELSEMVQRIRRGDREALRELISEYGAGVYRKAYQKTQDKDLAREATRRTFAQLVTTLQEQTDMDGWELWLNALAKRNIETYSNIRTDMAFMEGELNRELFDEAPSAPLITAGVAPKQPQQPSLGAFWQEGPFAQQDSSEEAAAARQRAQALAAQQEAERQRQAMEQQQAARRAAEEQAEARRQAAQKKQAEARRRAAMEQNKTPQNNRKHTQQARTPQAGSVEAQRMAARKQRSDQLFDEKKPPVRNGGNALTVVLLVLVCILLVWVALGICMSLEIIPRINLGYTWFNTHIVPFF